jgi:hypothetical protein
MPDPLYLDECVNRHLAERLDSHGVDATTAMQEGTLGFDDEAQLLFATRRQWMIVSHNQKHFLRLHAQFVREGRAHAGILLVPNGPLALLELRILMLVAWIETLTEPGPLLVRWHDLQQQLSHGAELVGFSSADIHNSSFRQVELVRG